MERIRERSINAIMLVAEKKGLPSVPRKCVESAWNGLEQGELNTSLYAGGLFFEAIHGIATELFETKGRHKACRQYCSEIVFCQKGKI